MKDDSAYFAGRCRLVFVDGFRIDVAVQACWMPRQRVWFGDLTAIRPDGDALADRIERPARLYSEEGWDGVVVLRCLPYLGPECVVFGLSGVGVAPFR